MAPLESVLLVSLFLFSSTWPWLFPIRSFVKKLHWVALVMFIFSRVFCCHRNVLSTFGFSEMGKRQCVWSLYAVLKLQCPSVAPVGVSSYPSVDAGPLIPSAILLHFCRLKELNLESMLLLCQACVYALGTEYWSSPLPVVRSHSGNEHFLTFAVFVLFCLVDYCVWSLT